MAWTYLLAQSVFFRITLTVHGSQSCRNVRHYQHDYSSTDVERMAPPALCPLCHTRTISCACGTNTLLTRSQNQCQTFKTNAKKSLGCCSTALASTKKRHPRALTGTKGSRANREDCASQYRQRLSLLVCENLKYSCASLLYHTA